MTPPPPPNNFTGKERQALRAIWTDPTLTLTAADKGNAAVVIDSAVYTNKMGEILSGSAYCILPGDPTAQRKLSLM